MKQHERLPLHFSDLYSLPSYHILSSFPPVLYSISLILRYETARKIAIEAATCNTDTRCGDSVILSPGYDQGMVSVCVYGSVYVFICVCMSVCVSLCVFKGVWESACMCIHVSGCVRVYVNVWCVFSITPSLTLSRVANTQSLTLSNLNSHPNLATSWCIRPCIEEDLLRGRFILLLRFRHIQ